MSRSRLCRLAIAAEAARIGGTALGPLEARVLEAVWGQGRALTVREVQGRFPDLAYTTLMTTLDRLYRKRLLLRSRRGRAFAYEGRAPGGPRGCCRADVRLKESGASIRAVGARGRGEPPGRRCWMGWTLVQAGTRA
jgi:hypothetical protein